MEFLELKRIPLEGMVEHNTQSLKRETYDSRYQTETKELVLVENDMFDEVYDIVVSEKEAKKSTFFSSTSDTSANYKNNIDKYESYVKWVESVTNRDQLSTVVQALERKKETYTEEDKEQKKQKQDYIDALECLVHGLDNIIIFSKLYTRGTLNTRDIIMSGENVLSAIRDFLSSYVCEKILEETPEVKIIIENAEELIYKRFSSNIFSHT